MFGKGSGWLPANGGARPCSGPALTLGVHRRTQHRRTVGNSPEYRRKAVSLATSGCDRAVAPRDPRPVIGHHDEVSRPTDAEPDGLGLDVDGVGGARISVRIGPVGTDVPILLVHGFGSSARANWSATGWLAQLARAGRTAVTVDVRGHGRSDKPHRALDYSLPIVMRDLIAVLAALPAVLGPLPTIDVIGYSMGGRLVGELIAASAGTPGTQPWPAGLPAIGRAVIGGYDGRPLLQDVDLAEFQAELAGAPGPDSPGRRMARIALAARGADLTALSAFVEGMAADPTRLPPASVAVPTLVVAGDRDVITDATAVWAAGLPDGRYLVLPGRNHISAVTSAVFRGAAVEFLAR